MKYSREIKIGLLVTASLALFVWGFNFIKGKNIFTNPRFYYVVYERVDGLAVANPVFINGYKVGMVNQVSLIPGSSGKILVKLTIDTDDFHFLKNSTAKIISSDLLGSKAIDLIPGKLRSDERIFDRKGIIYCIQGIDTFAILKNTMSAWINDNARVDFKGNKIYYRQKGETLPLGTTDQLLYATRGDTLLAEVELSFTDEVNATLRPLRDKTSTLITSVDSVMQLLQQAFSEESGQNIKTSLGSLNRTINRLDHTSSELDGLITDGRPKLNNIFGNLEVTTDMLKSRNSDLSRAIKNLSSLSDTLADAEIASILRNARTSLADMSEILGKIQRGEGSMGKLVNDDKLYCEVNTAANDLNRLLMDIQLNPHRYLHFSVFGKKEKEKNNKPNPRPENPGCK